MKPRPGHANTVSVTTVPAMNAAMMSAENVSGGMSEFFSACFQISVVFPTPFARASLMNSESRTSSIDERTSRINPADASHPRVTAGSMK